MDAGIRRLSPSLAPKSLWTRKYDLTPRRGTNVNYIARASCSSFFLSVFKREEELRGRKKMKLAKLHVVFQACVILWLVLLRGCKSYMDDIFHCESKVNTRHKHTHTHTITVTHKKGFRSKWIKFSHKHETSFSSSFLRHPCDMGGAAERVSKSVKEVVLANIDLALRSWYWVVNTLYANHLISGGTWSSILPHSPI